MGVQGLGVRGVWVFRGLGLGLRLRVGFLRFRDDGPGP